MTLAVLVQHQQTLAGPAVLPPTALRQHHQLQKLQHQQEVSELTNWLPIEAQFHQEITTRLRKRHSNWHASYEQEMRSQEIEWANPCGGVWLGRNSTSYGPGQRIPVKKILRILQNNAGREQKTLNLTTPAIDISDIRMWSLHKETYNFLPALKPNSNVALRRWHRHLQMYVASFAYLRRAQMRWDYHKSLHESEVAQELYKLKRSARSILCELETAVNSTSAHSHKPHSSLSTMSRPAMEKRLKFQTQLKHLYPPASRPSEEELHEPNPIDLKFVKNRYFALLRSMVKILRANNNKRPSHSSVQNSKKRISNTASVSPVISRVPNSQQPTKISRKHKARGQRKPRPQRPKQKAAN